MKLEEVKRKLNEIVRYKGTDDVYRLTACILRKRDSTFFYQAELTDTKHGRSYIICRLEDIHESEVKE